MGEQQFKVGDRVVVAVPQDGREWPDGSDRGYFFRAGNTGTVARAAGGDVWVDFDDQAGVRTSALGNRMWSVGPHDLRALSTNEGGR